MALITEDQLERQAIGWFQELGYRYAFGPDLAADATTPERSDFRQVVLTSRLRTALQTLNPHIPADSIESALVQLTNPNVPGLLAANQQLHRWLTQGLPVKYLDGSQEVGERLRILAFDDPATNDWLVVNQLTVSGPKHTPPRPGRLRQRFAPGGDRTQKSRR